MRTIERILCSAFLFAAACAARAQGTFEFTAYLYGTNVVPPSSTPSTGTGIFRLDGDLFSYEVRTLYLPDWAATIHGPAGPETNAPTLLNLRGVVCVPPLPPYERGYCLWRGSNTVSPAQISDLISGLWYAEVRDTYFPELAMRGQIVPIPEPQITILCLMGIGFVPLMAFVKRRACRGASLVLSAMGLFGGSVSIESAETNPPVMIVPTRKILTNGSRCSVGSALLVFLVLGSFNSRTQDCSAI